MNNVAGITTAETRSCDRCDAPLANVVYYVLGSARYCQDCYTRLPSAPNPETISVDVSKKESSGISDGIDATLAERVSRYGDFAEHARITQNIKRAMHDSPNWATMPDYMRECLEMVAHKMARILNGDFTYQDSWHDIIGYTRRVEQILERAEE